MDKPPPLVLPAVCHLPVIVAFPWRFLCRNFPTTSSCRSSTMNRVASNSRVLSCVGLSHRQQSEAVSGNSTEDIAVSCLPPHLQHLPLSLPMMHLWIHDSSVRCHSLLWSVLDALESQMIQFCLLLLLILNKSEPFLQCREIRF